MHFVLVLCNRFHNLYSLNIEVIYSLPWFCGKQNNLDFDAVLTILKL